MKLFAQTKVGLVAAAVALGIASLAFADGKEEKIKLGDCPEAVQKTIKEKAEGGKILEVEKETQKDGTVVYEAEVKKADGKVIEIEVDAEGKLIKVEDEDDEDDDEDEDENDDDDDEDDDKKKDAK